MSVHLSLLSFLVILKRSSEIMKKRGVVLRGERQMAEFREIIDGCLLWDLGFTGSCFTWQWGKLYTTLIHKRLDRFLATDTWCEMFSAAIV